MPKHKKPRAIVAPVVPCPGGELGKCDRLFITDYTANLHARYAHAPKGEGGRAPSRDPRPSEKRTSANSEQIPSASKQETSDPAPGREDDAHDLDLPTERPDLTPLRHTRTAEERDPGGVRDLDPYTCAGCGAIVAQNSPTCPNGHALQWS